MTRSALPERTGSDQIARLGRVVGAVGFHEDHGAGAGAERRSSPGETRIAVAAPGLAQQRGASPLDQRRTAVARAVVDEERALEQVERAQLGEQRRQRLGLVEDGHDDAVVVGGDLWCAPVHVCRR